MSIYSIMAFNAATDKIKQNIQDSQSIDAKRVQTQQAQEELDLNKKLDQAKVKQARNEGMMSDYVGNALEKHLNDSYKNKNDQLDALSGLQDINQHKAQTQAQQAASVATQLHANDPDVQGHVATLTGIMNAQGGQGNAPAAPQMSMADGSNQGAQPTPLPSIPGIAPVQGGVTPQNVDSQVAPQTGAPQTQAPQAVPQPQQAPQVPAQDAAQSQGQQGIDLSPIEQTFGMPKGSMWLNPATMKPEVSPIWKSQIEKQQAAQATYDVNKPFRQEQFYDKRFDSLQKTLDPSMYRAGAFGDAKKVFDRGERLKTLADATFQQPGGADSRQIAELAIGLQNMLSGGTGSTTEVMALLPRSIVGDVNKIQEWLTNNPTGLNQKQFVTRLEDTIYREMDTTQAQMDRTRIQRLSNFNDLKKQDEEKYNQMLQDYGLSQDKIDAYKKKGIQGLKDIAKDQRLSSDGQTQTQTSQKDYSSLWK